MSGLADNKAPALTELFWAIKGRWSDGGGQFFYCGTFLTRKDAIADHVGKLGHDWKTCYRNGDRAVKVEVTEFQR